MGSRRRIIPKGTRNRPLTRRQKILRAIYFTPLTLLFLERLYIPLEYADLAAYLDVGGLAVTEEAKAPTKRSALSAPPLEFLTRSSRTWTSSCPKHTETVTNVVQLANQTSTNKRRIPRIVHQTAKSRCVTPAFSAITSQWKLAGHEYYFHDDEAIARLFRLEFPEFPQLRQVIHYCIRNPTIKADLWRYLVLWLYGGIYADFDSAPNSFNANSIGRDDDAFFVVEQYHILSQWFMAVSPRHPLMYYAIQNTLENLMASQDTLKSGAHLVSGPHALHKAYSSFRLDANVLVDPIGTGMKPVRSGNFQGTNNRTITVVGKAENENEYVRRMAIDAFTRRRDYNHMGMTHFSTFMKPKAKMSGQSCQDAILADILELLP